MVSLIRMALTEKQHTQKAILSARHIRNLDRHFESCWSVCGLNGSAGIVWNKFSVI